MGKKGGRSGKRRTVYAVLVVCIAMAALAVIAYIIHMESRKDAERLAPGEKGKVLSKRPEVPKQPLPDRKIVTQEPEGTTGRQRKAEERPGETKRVAIIIDDIGYDLSHVRELLKIEAPVTFAIFPLGPHSLEAANILHRNGRQILLHLPMEPRQYPRIKVDKGALLMSMDSDAIKKQFDRDLQAVPHIAGVNNHMGSRFMEDPVKLAVVMQVVKDRGLFFIDSRTTPLSKGREVAAQIGVPFAARKVFMDNDKSYEETRKSLMQIIEEKKGGDYGDVIVIGHPRNSTIAALKSVLPLFKEQGIELVSASSVARQVQERNISRKTSSRYAN